MKKIVVVEIGSTNTKSYLYNGEIKDLGFVSIEFKNNYKKFSKILEEDKEKLYSFIRKIMEQENNIFVYGTSIFRNLNESEKDLWIKEFYDNTGKKFNIVTADMENEFTVYGAVNNINYNGKIAVMIGGGGSTELSIVENKKIIEKSNSNFGAMDTSDMFPDLRIDKAITDYEYMINETKKLVNIPNNKSNILILAGGDYIMFYEEMKYKLSKNKFYDSAIQPYCLDIAAMDKFDKDFFYEKSLEQIIKENGNEVWWRGARGMRLCVKSLVDILGVKYIIPTRISMVYGIIEKLKNEI